MESGGLFHTLDGIDALILLDEKTINLSEPASATPLACSRLLFLAQKKE